MKKQYLVLWLCLMSQLTLAQARFEYDAAGNRVKRTVTPYPDLTPILQVSPTIAYGNTALTARLTVVELKGVPTSGLITVKLTKDASVVLNFSPATTSVSGISVQNANWSLDNSDEDTYIFTSSTVIAGNGVSVIGLPGMLTTQGFSGTLSISMSIQGGSGGEIRTDNNLAATRIDYYAQ